jgi:hypothetical protein
VKKSWWMTVIAVSAAAAILGGCGQEAALGTQVDTTIHAEVSGAYAPPDLEAVSQPEIPEGPLNPLTGEAGYPESAVGKRPVAVMINNINAALPHRGLSDADILYEVAVEGGITRMLAVFADLDSIPDVGPVRSARHYYTDFVAPYDAIYVHFGGSTPGKAAIQNRGIDNIDGLIYGTTAFTKDNWRAQNRGVEHSYFIDGAAIRSVAEKRGYSLEGDAAAPFVISQEKIEPAQKSGGVYVKFSGYTNSEFIWNAETGLYEKLRNGEAHVDENTDRQLQFANVVVLSTSITSYDGGDLREVALNSGSGWFFTGGGYEEISWKKGNYQNQFSFTKKDGSPIEGNVGPTFIAIIDQSMVGSMQIK